MAVNNGRIDEERHGKDSRLGLGLSLSLGIATTDEVVDPPRHQQRAISVAPISSLLPAPQWWNGGPGGLFFSPSSSSSSSGMMMTMDPYPSLERKQHQHQHQQQPVTCHISHDEMPFLRGIDVNRAPAGGETAARSRRRGGSCSEDDEEPGASSSPNSTLSSLSLKRAAPARSGGEVDRDQAGQHTPRGAGGGGGGSDEEDYSAGAGGGGSRKKLRLSKDQAAVLEDTFKEHNTLNPNQKAALAKELNLKPRQVEVWFQNRRARTKMKQTEVDCELLKRCCETLTDENRRLQREVAELRALKLVAAPHHHARMPPPTTLTMCPSCERLASSSAVAGEAAGRAGLWCPLPVRPVFVDGPARRS